MCIRDSSGNSAATAISEIGLAAPFAFLGGGYPGTGGTCGAVSYTHLRAHETVLDLVCRLLLEKKQYKIMNLFHDSPLPPQYVHIITGYHGH